MAAQRRGSVNVLVQPPKDSFEAMATLPFLPLGQRFATVMESFGGTFREALLPQGSEWELAAVQIVGPGTGGLTGASPLLPHFTGRRQSEPGCRQRVAVVRRAEPGWLRSPPRPGSAGRSCSVRRLVRVRVRRRRW
ncbi:hypothetical protein GCM10019017_22910 [Streptomyces showdoensis]